MSAEDRTALAHRVLVAVEEGLAKAQRDRAWYEATKDKRVAAASTVEFAIDQARFYDEMIGVQTVVIDAYRAVLGDAVPTAADPLALGEHFIGVGR